MSKLKFAINDIVYVIYNNITNDVIDDVNGEHRYKTIQEVRQAKIYRIEVRWTEDYKNVLYWLQLGNILPCYPFPEYELFTTKAEAEAKLKEMKDD